MARYAEGDDGAFDTLYAEVAPRLIAWLLRQSQDRTQAEDLLQQTMLQLHRARGTFVPGAQVMPWAFAISRRLLIDEVRREGRRKRVIDPGAAPDVADPRTVSGYDRVQLGQLTTHLDRTLQGLPEPQRVAYELIRLDGLTLVEAAQATGCTIAALKSRSHRAYEALRAALRLLLEGTCD